MDVPAFKKRAPTTRQLNSQKSRENIYRTAITLFNQYGYDKITVEDITQQAGMSKGAFYVHFSSKDDILLEHFRQTDSFYEKFLETYKDSNLTATQQLFAFSEYMMRYIQSTMGLEVTKIVYIKQLRDATPVPEKFLGDEQRPFHLYLERILASGQAAGEFRRDLPPLTLKRLVTRFMRGTIYDWCMSGGDFDLPVAFQRFLHLNLASLQTASDADILVPAAENKAPDGASSGSA